MNKYDPEVAPAPDEWLALSEDVRYQLIEKFHRSEGGYGGSLKLHATLHAIVENQLAMQLPPAQAALDRLRKDGLNRHDSVHAIGTVLTNHFWETLHGNRAKSIEPNEEYYEELSKLTKDSWYASFEEDD